MSEIMENVAAVVLSWWTFYSPGGIIPRLMIFLAAWLEAGWRILLGGCAAIISR